jgi:hypothetical protein
METLNKIPSESIQLVICDPPYNINVAVWDDMEHYVDWAAKWMREVERVLAPSHPAAGDGVFCKGVPASRIIDRGRGLRWLQTTGPWSPGKARNMAIQLNPAA